MSVSEDEKIKIKLIHVLVEVIGMSKNRMLPPIYETIKQLLEEIFGQLVANAFLERPHNMDEILKDYFSITKEGMDFASDLLKETFKKYWKRLDN